MEGINKKETEIKKDADKRPYERATIEEHEPLEKATAYIYYYYA